MKEIRISASSFAVIKFDDSYLLCLNKACEKRGQKVYTPLGGSLEFDDKGRNFLDSLGAEYEKQGNDLRLYMPKTNLDILRDWFNSGKNRENSCFRELREELVDEGVVLTHLHPNHVTIENIPYRVEEIGKSNRGRVGIDSYYFFEYYKTEINHRLQDRILENMLDSNYLYLASRDEIHKNKTDNGIEIGSNANYLLDLK